VRYIRLYRRLHPKILAEGRVSRTEVFNAIFGDNQQAKNIAHTTYNRCYQQYYGKVKPIQQGVGEYLNALHKSGIGRACTPLRSTTSENKGGPENIAH